MRTCITRSCWIHANSLYNSLSLLALPRILDPCRLQQSGFQHCEYGSLQSLMVCLVLPSLPVAAKEINLWSCGLVNGLCCWSQIQAWHAMGPATNFWVLRTAWKRLSQRCSLLRLPRWRRVKQRNLIKVWRKTWLWAKAKAAKGRARLAEPSAAQILKQKQDAQAKAEEDARTAAAQKQADAEQWPVCHWFFPFLLVSHHQHWIHHLNFWLIHCLDLLLGHNLAKPIMF